MSGLRDQATFGIGEPQLAVIGGLIGVTFFVVVCAVLLFDCRLRRRAPISEVQIDVAPSSLSLAIPIIADEDQPRMSSFTSATALFTRRQNDPQVRSRTSSGGGAGQAGEEQAARTLSQGQAERNAARRYHRTTSWLDSNAPGPASDSESVDPEVSTGRGLGGSRMGHDSPLVRSWSKECNWRSCSKGSVGSKGSIGPYVTKQGLQQATGSGGGEPIKSAVCKPGAARPTAGSVDGAAAHSASAEPDGPAARREAAAHRPSRSSRRRGGGGVNGSPPRDAASQPVPRSGSEGAMDGVDARMDARPDGRAKVRTPPRRRRRTEGGAAAAPPEPHAPAAGAWHGPCY